ncbi:GntR family transcriptional regulator [Streptomyces sp. M10(2022)]
MRGPDDRTSSPWRALHGRGLPSQAAPRRPAPFRTKAYLAAEHIKQQIMSGEAEPGRKIVARAVAEAVGVSETPVREAVKQLVSEGWLAERPHVGAVVAQVTVENARELYGVRATLSALALELGGPLEGPASNRWMRCWRPRPTSWPARTWHSSPASTGSSTRCCATRSRHR